MYLFDVPPLDCSFVMRRGSLCLIDIRSRLHHHVMYKIRIHNIHHVRYLHTMPHQSQPIRIDFTWHRHIKGYRIKDGRVVPDSNDYETYRPLDEYSTLYKIFADQCRSPKGVLGFTHKFGPLSTNPGTLVTIRALNLAGARGTVGDLVRDVIEHAELMNKYLSGYSRGIPQIPLTNIEAVLVPDGRSVRIKLSSLRLIDAIWLQMAQASASGRGIAECQRCGTWFEVGPGTGRRADAKFCCDRHRIEHNSLERSKKR